MTLIGIGAVFLVIMFGLIGGCVIAILIMENKNDKFKMLSLFKFWRNIIISILLFCGGIISILALLQYYSNIKLWIMLFSLFICFAMIGIGFGVAVVTISIGCEEY